MTHRLHPVVAMLLLMLVVAPFRADAAFDANHLLSDSALEAGGSMGLGEVQRFFEERGAYLALMWQPDSAGLLKFPAEILWLAANEARINPRVLLVMLQKEQGLAEERAPRASQLDWAMGYGCPDGSGCNPRFQGFGKQVRGAALQLRGYLDDLATKGETIARWAVGRTKTTADGYEVTPANRATSALYSYTPWRGSDTGKGGNYLFASLWSRWFGGGRYPDGAVLRGSDGAEWRIAQGHRQRFASTIVRRTYAPDAKVVVVGDTDIAAYREGAAVRFANYAVMEDATGIRWLLVDSARRRIANAEVFRQLGFHPEEVEDATPADLTAYTEGTPVATVSDNPQGALVRDTTNGKEYLVVGAVKRPILHAAIREARFPGGRVEARKGATIATLTTGDPVTFPDGEFLTAPKFLPQAFIISQGKRRPLASPRVAEELGYAWTNLRVVSDLALALHPEGAPITGGFEGGGLNVPIPTPVASSMPTPEAPVIRWHNLSVF